MAYQKKEKAFQTLLLMIVVASPAIATNVDCNGKAFHCVNSTHFMICVDLGGGVSKTVDDFVIPCPPTTACQGSNHFECEYLVTTTQQSILSQSDATNEIKFETSTLPVDDFGVSTFFPPQKTNTLELSEKYFNTVSTTTLTATEISTEPTTAVTHEQILDQQTTTLRDTDTISMDNEIRIDNSETSSNPIDENTLVQNVNKSITREEVINASEVKLDNMLTPELIDALNNKNNTVSPGQKILEEKIETRLVNDIKTETNKNMTGIDLEKIYLNNFTTNDTIGSTDNQKLNDNNTTVRTDRQILEEYTDNKNEPNKDLHQVLIESIHEKKSKTDDTKNISSILDMITEYTSAPKLTDNDILNSETVDNNKTVLTNKQILEQNEVKVQNTDSIAKLNQNVNITTEKTTTMSHEEQTSAGDNSVRNETIDKRINPNLEAVSPANSIVTGIKNNWDVNEKQSITEPTNSVVSPIIDTKINISKENVSSQDLDKTYVNFTSPLDSNLKDTYYVTENGIRYTTVGENDTIPFSEVPNTESTTRKSNLIRNPEIDPISTQVEIIRKEAFISTDTYATTETNDLFMTDSYSIDSSIDKKQPASNSNNSIGKQIKNEFVNETSHKFISFPSTTITEKTSTIEMTHTSFTNTHPHTSMYTTAYKDPNMDVPLKLSVYPEIEYLTTTDKAVSTNVDSFSSDSGRVTSEKVMTKTITETMQFLEVTDLKPDFRNNTILYQENASFILTTTSASQIIDDPVLVSTIPKPNINVSKVSQNVPNNFDDEQEFLTAAATIPDSVNKITTEYSLLPNEYNVSEKSSHHNDIPTTYSEVMEIMSTGDLIKSSTDVTSPSVMFLETTIIPNNEISSTYTTTPSTISSEPTELFFKESILSGPVRNKVADNIDKEINSTVYNNDTESNKYITDVTHAKKSGTAAFGTEVFTKLPTDNNIDKESIKNMTELPDAKEYSTATPGTKEATLLYATNEMEIDNSTVITNGVIEGVNLTISNTSYANIKTSTLSTLVENNSSFETYKITEISTPQSDIDTHQVQLEYNSLEPATVSNSVIITEAENALTIPMSSQNSANIRELYNVRSTTPMYKIVLGEPQTEKMRDLIINITVPDIIDKRPLHSDQLTKGDQVIEKYIKPKLDIQSEDQYIPVTTYAEITTSKSETSIYDNYESLTTTTTENMKQVSDSYEALSNAQNVLTKPHVISTLNTETDHLINKFQDINNMIKNFPDNIALTSLNNTIKVNASKYTINPAESSKYKRNNLSDMLDSEILKRVYLPVRVNETENKLSNVIDTLLNTTQSTGNINNLHIQDQFSNVPQNKENLINTGHNNRTDFDINSMKSKNMFTDVTTQAQYKIDDDIQTEESNRKLYNLISQSQEYFEVNFNPPTAIIPNVQSVQNVQSMDNVTLNSNTTKMNRGSSVNNTNYMPTSKIDDKRSLVVISYNNDMSMKSINSLSNVAPERDQKYVNISTTTPVYNVNLPNITITDTNNTSTNIQSLPKKFDTNVKLSISSNTTSVNGFKDTTYTNVLGLTNITNAIHHITENYSNLSKILHLNVENTTSPTSNQTDQRFHAKVNDEYQGQLEPNDKLRFSNKSHGQLFLSNHVTKYLYNLSSNNDSNSKQDQIMKLNFNLAKKNINDADKTQDDVNGHIIHNVNRVTASDNRVTATNVQENPAIIKPFINSNNTAGISLTTTERISVMKSPLESSNVNNNVIVDSSQTAKKKNYDANKMLDDLHGLTMYKTNDNSVTASNIQQNAAIIKTNMSSNKIASVSLTTTERIRVMKSPIILQSSNAYNNVVAHSNHINTSSNFNCQYHYRGRYADKDNCRIFYICIGRMYPIIGACPVNTVFSDIKKQCTRDMSHCIRNNEFRCMTEGRFSDLLQENIYYICVKNKDVFVRFKLQCQNGYHFNKTSVHCVHDSVNVKKTKIVIKDTSKKSSDQSTVETKSTEGEKLKKQQENHKTKFECEHEGKFPNPHDCKKYYVCSRNSKSVFRRRSKKCDSDEVFNSEKKKCVDEDSYECE